MKEKLFGDDMGFLNDLGLEYFYNKMKQYVDGKSVKGVTKAEFDTMTDKSGLLVVTDEDAPGVDLPAGSNVPAGGIIIWSGASDAIPEGWSLCDGTNGTPDLRGRFVLGQQGAVYANSFYSDNLTVDSPSASIVLQVKEKVSSISIGSTVEVKTAVNSDPPSYGYKIYRNSIIIASSLPYTFYTTFIVGDIIKIELSMSGGSASSYVSEKYLTFMKTDKTRLTKDEFNSMFDIIETNLFHVEDDKIHNGYALNSTGGKNEVTLTLDEMPKHSHVERVADADGTYTLSKTDGFFSGNYVLFSNEGILDYGKDALKTAEEGGDYAHENMPPYYTLCYIMKL